jgi:hypothetical protein
MQKESRARIDNSPLVSRVKSNAIVHQLMNVGVKERMKVGKVWRAQQLVVSRGLKRVLVSCAVAKT